MDKLIIKWVYVFLGTIGALLLGYFCYSISEGCPNDYVAGIVSSICFIVTIVPFIGVSHESSTLNANLKTLSSVVVVIMLISNFAFAATEVKMPYYPIVNGILLIAYWVVYLKIANKKDL